MANKFITLRNRLTERLRMIRLIERCPYCLASKELTVVKQAFLIQDKKVTIVMHCGNCKKKSVWTLERCEEDQLK